MGTDHNLLLWQAERGGRNEYDKQGRSSVRKKRKCSRGWRWRTSGKVNWEGHREKVEENMDLFAKDMTSNPGSGWTAKVFQSYLNEAAGDSLGKRCWGNNKKGKQRVV